MILITTTHYSSTVNIGIHREIDNKWVKQYSALLCILNAKGQGLTWKLTKSIKFTAVTDILSTLRERLNKKGNPVQEFTIDNCCAWRKKIQSLFGNRTQIKLDLVHAIQRVTRTISKRHKLSQMCCDHFRMVFRAPEDKGDIRTLPTPSPGIYA